MKIKVNGGMREISEGSTISEIFSQLDIKTTAGIALAVNNSVVSKKKWDSTTIQAEDDILIIRATQGG
ncbi:MAG: sulfur carrier protein ThiS [Bacteroidales bacterium]|nr:sulfur carrier protein ThiS [Bacteroidales bacterium]